MNMRNLVPWGRDRKIAPRTDQQNPFELLHSQMNRLFDDFFRDFDLPMTSRAGWSAWPSVEVRETEKSVHVIAELPGMDEKDIEVTLRNGVLTLKGEKKGETSEALYSERWHGAFERSIEVGPEVDPDRVEATFHRGVLTITLAKKPDAINQAKRIQISRSS